MKKTIKFLTLGCKANQYDTQSIRERFLKKGFQETSRSPQYFLINTCTVTSGADQKSRYIIRRSIQDNPNAKIIVTGCLAEKDWKSLCDIKGVSLVVKKSFFAEGISSFGRHTRAFLKVQDGCNNFCTYCKVALVRGKPRSRKLKEIIEEAERLAACGYKEIVLTGICLGAYRSGLSPKKNLADLVGALEKIKGLLRIRLSSIEAADINPALIKRLEKSKKFCRHLHIPIQSGDDSILKMMNRKYTGNTYFNLINNLKRRIPQLCITTDCLVGFPGETDENFKNTLELVKKIAPLKAHIFPFSPRPGTKAANFKPAVKPEIIRQRCKELDLAAGKCREKILQSFLSSKVLVLIEGRAKNDPAWLEGFSDNYLPVKLPFKPGLKNKIVSVKLIDSSKDGLTGEFIDIL